MGERVHRSYRLSADVAEDLARWAGEDGISATELVERAIRLYGRVNHGQAHDGDTANHDANHAETRTGAQDGAAIEALASQLAVKDGQIARLMDALSQAQESVKAAQVLDAAHTAKAFEGDATDADESEGRSDPKRGVLARIRDWLRS